ncbi:MAG: alpha/beta hydrolase [Opitutaceae bacterium]|nr:alpha/beta hydrolase [Opitutaceae bacterium]
MKLTYQHTYEPGRDSAAPPLLLLHGTGGDEHDLLPLGRELSPGSALLSPRGDVLEHGRPRFFRRLAEGVFDYADVERRTQALADFIRAAAGHYGFAADRLLAVGFSNGANIAASLLLRCPDALAAAALLRPMVVLRPDPLPDLAGKRVLIASGDADPIVPAGHPEELAALFRRAGATVRLQTHRAGHGLVPADFAVAREFVDGA